MYVNFPGLSGNISYIQARFPGLPNFWADKKKQHFLFIFQASFSSCLELTGKGEGVGSLMHFCVESKGWS